MDYTRDYDPFAYGIAAIVTNEAEKKEAKRIRDKSYRPKKYNAYTRQVALQKERAYKVAKYLYQNGETNKKRIAAGIGVSSVRKTIEVMTYMDFLFDGQRWAVYETDDNLRIGLVNKHGQTPTIKTPEPVKDYKVVVWVNGVPKGFMTVKAAADYIGCDRKTASNMLHHDQVFSHYKNIEVTWVNESQ